MSSVLGTGGRTTPAELVVVLGQGSRRKFAFLRPNLGSRLHLLEPLPFTCKNESLIDAFLRSAESALVDIHRERLLTVEPVALLTDSFRGSGFQASSQRPT